MEFTGKIVTEISWDTGSSFPTDKWKMNMEVLTTFNTNSEMLKVAWVDRFLTVWDKKEIFARNALMGTITMVENVTKFLKLAVNLTTKTTLAPLATKDTTLTGIMFVRKLTFCVWPVIREETAWAAIVTTDSLPRADVSSTHRVVTTLQLKRKMLCVQDSKDCHARSVCQDATWIAEECARSLTPTVKSSTTGNRNVWYVWRVTRCPQMETSARDRADIDCYYLYSNNVFYRPHLLINDLIDCQSLMTKWSEVTLIFVKTIFKIKR